MKHSKLAFAIGVGAIVTNTSIAKAHNPYIEPQTRYEQPQQAPATADFSFDNPFNLDAVPGGVEQSAAIFSYLTPHDVDVFSFAVVLPLLVNASALPPACKQTKNNYPVTALLGPGLPAPSPDLNLPFTVPEGYGVVFADNPPLKRREVFFAEDDLNLSWFLPLGLSQDCLLTGTCDFSNVISRFVTIPGTYYIAIWDKSGKPQDYTANIGFREDLTNPDPVILDAVRDNKLLHTPCTDPYPGNPLSH